MRKILGVSSSKTSRFSLVDVVVQIRKRWHGFIYFYSGQTLLEICEMGFIDIGLVFFWCNIGLCRRI